MAGVTQIGMVFVKAVLVMLGAIEIAIGTGNTIETEVGNKIEYVMAVVVVVVVVEIVIAFGRQEMDRGRAVVTMAVMTPAVRKRVRTTAVVMWVVRRAVWVMMMEKRVEVVWKLKVAMLVKWLIQNQN